MMQIAFARRLEHSSGSKACSVAGGVGEDTGDAIKVERHEQPAAQQQDPASPFPGAVALRLQPLPSELSMFTFMPIAH